MSQWNGPGRVGGHAWLNAWRDRPRLGSAWLVTGAFTLVRAGYGVGLVCAPQLLIRWAGDREPSQRACAVARVLGVRHLAQAVLVAAAWCADPTSRVPVACGAAVDFLHASTMVGVAAVDRTARRVALVDAGVESTLGVAGIVAAGGPDGSDGCGSIG
jgi:hypothetical protein